MPQIVFAEEATRFLREPTTSGEVLKMGFRFWPSALTTPTPMPARREGAAALNAIARLGGNNGNKTRRQLLQHCLCDGVAVVGGRWFSVDVDVAGLDERQAVH